MDPRRHFITEEDWVKHYQKDLQEAFDLIKLNSRLGVFENLNFEDFVKESYRVFSSKRKIPN